MLGLHGLMLVTCCVGSPLVFTETRVEELPFISGTSELSAASGDLNADGLDDLVVMRKVFGAPPALVLLAQPDGRFAAPQELDLDSGDRVDFILDDVNADGATDILSGSGRLYLNNGLGQFSLAESPQFAPGPASTGDLNGDGLTDVVVASGSALLVYLATAPGDFAQPITHSLQPAGFTQHTLDDRVIIARVDSTSAPDVFVRNVRITRPTDPSAATVSTLTFAAPDGSSVTRISASGALSLDADEADELLVSAVINSQATLRALSLVGGSFVSTSEPHIGFEGPFSALGRDLDGDSDTDLIVSSRLTAEADIFLSTLQPLVTVLVNDGSGGLAVHGSFSGGSFWTRSVVAGRFRPSGCEEVLAVSSGIGLIATGGPIRYWPPTLARFDACENVFPFMTPSVLTHSLRYASTPPIIAFGDLNGDALFDAFGFASGLFQCRLALSADRWSTRRVPAATSDLQQTQLVQRIDVDGDGNAENVAAWASTTREITTVPTSSPPVPYTVEPIRAIANPLPFPARIAAPPNSVLADLNGDGAPDVISRWFSGGITISMSQPDSTFSFSTHYAGIPRLIVVSVGAMDVNVDGWPDILLCHGIIPTQSSPLPPPLMGGVLVWPNLGDGTGALGQPYLLHTSDQTVAAASMLVADVTSDGRPDLLFSDSVGNLFTWRSTPEGLAAPGVRNFAPLWLNELRAADLDSDGDIDLLTKVNDPSLAPWSSFQQFIHASQRPWILLNNGAGGFGLPIEGPAANGFLSSAEPLDADGDGRLDIVMLPLVGPATVHFNRSPSTPPPPCPGDANGDRLVDNADLSMLLASYNSDVTPGSSGDFDGSGRVDGADLSVFLNRFGLACE